jgi:hypothetical protein
MDPRENRKLEQWQAIAHVCVSYLRQVSILTRQLQLRDQLVEGMLCELQRANPQP